MSDVYHKVIHLQGGLSVAQMQDFDERDYRLASNKPFDDERAAVVYARELAATNGLEFIGGPHLDPGILDEPGTPSNS